MEMAQGLWHTAEGQAVALLGAIAALSLSLLLLLLHRHRPSKLNLPPSPLLSLPFLGHIIHIGKAITLHHSLGPIFTIYIGNTPIIYVTSSALAHEALIQKGSLFAARPLMASRALFTSNFRNINSASYGSHWRSVRRNLVHEMLSVPKILSFHSIRAQVLDLLISAIRTEAQLNHGVVSIYPNLRVAMFRLLLFMCFGFHMSEEDLLQMSALLDEVVLLAAGMLQDFYPFTRLFNRKKQVWKHDLRAKQVRIFTSHIDKHKELQKLGKLTPGSYLETLLHMNAGNGPLSNDDIVTLCSEFMVGGTDTTVTTLEWAMARILIEPSIQNKLYCEIRDVVGDRLVEEKDLPNLPYLRAVIKETLRLHPPGHMLMPHAVSGPCKLGGYDIPPHAVIMFVVTTISRDPELWEEPLSFKPERFLAADVDITGTKEVSMIPFGAGRRICPGLGLASMHMEMVIACLMQALEWTSYPLGETVDLSEKFIFTVRLRHPLRAHIKDRQGS